MKSITIPTVGSDMYMAFGVKEETDSLSPAQGDVVVGWINAGTGRGGAGRLLPLRLPQLRGRGGELPGHQQARRTEERGDVELCLQGQLHHDHLQEVTGIK